MRVFKFLEVGDLWVEKPSLFAIVFKYFPQFKENNGQALLWALPAQTGKSQSHFCHRKECDSGLIPPGIHVLLQFKVLVPYHMCIYMTNILPNAADNRLLFPIITSRASCTDIPLTWEGIERSSSIFSNFCRIILYTFSLVYRHQEAIQQVI